MTVLAIGGLSGSSAYALDMPNFPGLRAKLKQAFTKDKFSWMGETKTWFIRKDSLEMLKDIIENNGYTVATKAVKAKGYHPALTRQGYVFIDTSDSNSMVMHTPFNDQYKTLVKDKLKGKWTGNGWRLPKTKQNYLLFRILAKRIYKVEPIVFPSVPSF